MILELPCVRLSGFWDGSGRCVMSMRGECCLAVAVAAGVVSVCLSKFEASWVEGSRNRAAANSSHDY